MIKEKINWEDDALEKINKATFFIRGFAKSKVEKAAQEKGMEKITLEFMEQVRNDAMSKV